MPREPLRSAASRLWARIARLCVLADSAPAAGGEVRVTHRIVTDPAFRSSCGQHMTALRPHERLADMVPTRSPIFIGIDVLGDKLLITLWRDGERNAIYAPVSRDWALQRSLPQAIDEAIAFATGSGHAS